MRYCLAFVAALCAVLFANACCAAENEVIWQVGKRDNSYDEFAVARDYPTYSRRFGGGAVFEVGRSDPAKDWPFIQPGPIDAAWSGPGEHPFEVHFDLDSIPQGPFMLRIDLVDVQSQFAPTLKVRINENSRFYDLEPGASDASLHDPANGRGQAVKMYVSAGFLRKGRNIVNLDVVRGSWVLYDCVSFEKAGRPPHVIENLSLKPTCLFKKRGDRLKQVMLAPLEVYEDLAEVRAHVTGEAGWKADQVFRNVVSGNRELEIEVPSVESAQKVRLTLNAGGETFEAEGTVTPQKRWRIYMMPSAHFDIGYTAVQDKALQTHRENTERAIAWCESCPGFVWDLEASYMAMDYVRRGGKPTSLLSLAQKGRIGVQGFFGNELTGICSHEGLVRLVDYYDALRHEYGIESRTAMQTDVPTMVATVPMVLAGHGIKYLSHGVNATRARPDQELYNTPFYWESPDGSRVLMWKTPGYGQSGGIGDLGYDGSLSGAIGRVSEILKPYMARKDYPFDAILLHGAYGDNQPSQEVLARLPELWNSTYEYPKLIFTQGPEFFEHIEAGFAKAIRTVKGDGGVWWEDGVGSSARETAITRTAKEELLTAEKLVAVSGKKAQQDVAKGLSDAWENVLLYDEHTWGAAQSISEPASKATLEQWEVKKSFADKAARSARSALDLATDRFCATVSAGADSVVVFNPSSWARSEWVEVTKPGGSLLRLLAENVPPLGYKVIPISSVPKPDLPPVSPGDFLENRFYKISFDGATGAVTSIYDKELDRELVDPSRHGLNAYLYVTGAESSRLLNFSTGDRWPDLKIDTCAGAKLEKGALSGGQTMTVTSSGPNAKSFSAVITLRDDCKRIDFRNMLDKEENLKKEAGYFAFPFAFKDPKVRLEIPGGVIRPELDQFPGACKDWYAVQQFITVADDKAAVAWTAMDSPLITLQDINRGQWYDHLRIENGSVFAYVFNNYWWTNYKASQGGEHTFRFSITSARSISDIQAKRFGESVQSPMVARFVKGKQGTKTASSKSFVRVHGEGVVVQAMKPARFSDGTVIRLREMSGKSAKVKLAVSGIGFKRAYLCNLAEDKLSALVAKDGAIDVPCRALGLATVLLER